MSLERRVSQWGKKRDRQVSSVWGFLRDIEEWEERVMLKLGVIAGEWKTGGYHAKPGRLLRLSSNTARYIGEGLNCPLE